MILNIALLLASFCNAAQPTPSTRYALASTSDVIKAAMDYHPQAVRELGIRRERSATELLKKIADEPDVPESLLKRNHSLADETLARQQFNKNVSHHQAKIALAKLGEAKYLQQFFDALSSTDPFKRTSVMADLGDIGDPRAIKLLIPILDETGKTPKRGWDDFGREYRLTAEQALENILPNVYAEFDTTSKSTITGSINAWKSWWKDHHAEYENLK